MFLFVFLFSHRLKLVFANVEKCSAVNVGKHFMTNKLRFVHKIWMFFFFAGFSFLKSEFFPKKQEAQDFSFLYFVKSFLEETNRKASIFQRRRKILLILSELLRFFLSTVTL